MISTHILDTHLGRPASDVYVELRQNNHIIATAYTDKDGRIKYFTDYLAQGHYSLLYHIAPYFEQQQLTTFFPEVCIQFYIQNTQEHYHIPLLMSPYAYSTYRGS